MGRKASGLRPVYKRIGQQGCRAKVAPFYDGLLPTAMAIFRRCSMTIQNTSFSAVFQSITFLCKILIAGMILVFFSVQTSLPADITLAWDPNTEADLAAYKIYYKTGASGAPYDGTGADQGGSGFRVPLESLAQQGSPTYTLTGLPDATYYFVVTAVDSQGYESGYSNEVVWKAGSTVSTYTITSSSGANGSITPAGSTTLAEGEN